MESSRCVLIEIHDEMDKDDLKILSYLTKDYIPNRERKKIDTALELFTALEKKAVIRCCKGKELRVEFLIDCFTLMGRLDLVRILRSESLLEQQPMVESAENNFLNEKRKLLYNVGAETGGSELDALKTQLRVSSLEVGKRALDQIVDVWDCLDLMEERMEDGELISLLKRVYRDDDKLPGLLDDYTRGLVSAGATGGQVDKVPVQVEGGEEENQAPPPQTEDREQPQELTFNPPPSGSSTMIPDGASSGFSIPQATGLRVYDRGRRPGYCIIFNNEKFVDERTHPTRVGTNEDRDQLIYVFKTLFGFEVSVFDNKSREEIMEILTDFQTRDYTDYGAYIVCTLSHGDHTGVAGACGQTVSVDSMTSLFRADSCPTLAGKPKIFIFQACQGQGTQNIWHRTHDTIQAEGDTHLMNGVPDVTSTELPQLLEPPVTSAEADFLIAQSTMPGYISLRSGDGSFFIQSFVKHIKQHSPREDVVSILVEVNRDVSQKVGQTEGGQLAVQIPEPKVRLTKKLYLFPVESEV